MPSGPQSHSQANEIHEPEMPGLAGSAAAGATTQLKVCAECAGHLPAEQYDFVDEDDSPMLCPRCWEVRIDEHQPLHVFVGAMPANAQLSSMSYLNTSVAPSMHPMPSLLPSICDSEASSSVSSTNTEYVSLSVSLPESRPRHAPPPRILQQFPQASQTLRRPLQEPQPSPATFVPTPSRTTLPAEPPPLSSTSTYEPRSSSPLKRSRESAPDPFTDITRLRVRQMGHHCLYSGATFKGVQRSGRNSYDVTVKIVDVDLSTSFLCGYLEIRGLTEDWPELTTYFDAEIIGPRYGFITKGWGATEDEDLSHWERFPPFRSPSIQRDLVGPHLNLKDLPPGQERGCVFMRWKERFLVPDHRVRDINGASFAGFYYVCVEFAPEEYLEISGNDEEKGRGGGDCMQQDEEDEWETGRNPAFDTFGQQGEVTASMSGFYFHQHSEPFQHLSLHHVPNLATGSFEFR